MIAEHRRPSGRGKHPVRGRVRGRVAVGGMLGAPREQHIALVNPRLPEIVKHEDHPVHPPLRQADVEVLALGQPIAGESEQVLGYRHQAAEGGAG